MNKKLKLDFEYNATRFCIDFEGKINLLEDNSGTGKTFLCTALRSYLADKGIPCLAINSKIFQHLDFQNLILDGKEVIILDNADLYLTDELLERLKKSTAIVIIALHDSLQFNFGKETIRYFCEYKNSTVTVRRW